MADSFRVARSSGCEFPELQALARGLNVQETSSPGRSSVPPASHLQDFAATIEGAVIPRLLLNHGASEPVAVAGAVLEPDAIDTFVMLAMSGDSRAPGGFVEDLVARGVLVENILLDLMAPAARRMGEMWTEDLCSFVDVTLGLTRMQQLMRRFAGRSEVFHASAACKGRALLVPVPGEQHILGLRIVEEFFLRDGWDVTSNPQADLRDIAEMVSEDTYDFVGFSVSGERLLASLDEAIRQVRSASRNRSVLVMAGGALFADHPEFAGEVGADIVAFDARDG